MFFKKDKGFLNLVESFIDTVEGKEKIFIGKETQIKVYMFFGNYRLVVTNEVCGKFYRILVDGEVLITVERDLMGNEWVKNPSNISYANFKKMLDKDKLAYNPSSQNKVTKLRVSNEVV